MYIYTYIHIMCINVCVYCVCLKHCPINIINYHIYFVYNCFQLYCLNLYIVRTKWKYSFSYAIDNELIT